MGKRPKSLGVETGRLEVGGATRQERDRDSVTWTCEDCPLRKLPFCSNVIDVEPQNPHVAISRNVVRARQAICRKDQTADELYMIKEGWAFRYVVTANGRRQILSFLMPGDLMAFQSLYNDKISYSIQSITDVVYCGFNREDMKKLVASCPKTLRILAETCEQQRQSSDERLVDLGTRSAEERVARLLLDVMQHQEKRGRVHNHMFDFPLKQLHLADALGLTQVHVNRVLKRLKEGGMIEWSRGILTIVNLSAMKQIADIR